MGGIPPESDYYSDSRPNSNIPTPRNLDTQTQNYNIITSNEKQKITQKD